MKSIKALTRTELLSLIYNNLTKTELNHPCYCVACGETKEKNPPIKPIGYICDKCEKSLADMGKKSKKKWLKENKPPIKAGSWIKVCLDDCGEWTDKWAKMLVTDVYRDPKGESWLVNVAGGETRLVAINFDYYKKEGKVKICKKVM